MTRATVISNEVIKLRRKIKFFLFGPDDVRTATQVAPFGVDSNPIKNMRAIYSPTSSKGKGVIIGYINDSHLADLGETRLYSVNAAGEVQTYVWLKNNGDILFGGDARTLAAFNELKAGFDQLKVDFNASLTHVHGGAGTPPTPPIPISTASIDGAEINNVKA